MSLVTPQKSLKKEEQKGDAYGKVRGDIVRKKMKKIADSKVINTWRSGC